MHFGRSREQLKTQQFNKFNVGDVSVANNYHISCHLEGKFLIKFFFLMLACARPIKYLLQYRSLRWLGPLAGYLIQVRGRKNCEDGLRTWNWSEILGLELNWSSELGVFDFALSNPRLQPFLGVLPSLSLRTKLQQRINPPQGLKQTNKQSA